MLPQPTPRQLAWLSASLVEPLTDRLIHELREDARAHADDLQVHICNVALGTQAPVTTAEAFEERYGGGGFNDSDRADILEIATVEQAKVLCVEAINAGRWRTWEHDDPQPVRVRVDVPIPYRYLDDESRECRCARIGDPNETAAAALEYLRAEWRDGEWLYQETPTGPWLAPLGDLAELGAAVLDGRGEAAYSLWCQ